jgi:hypothetical protein
MKLVRAFKSETMASLYGDTKNTCSIAIFTCVFVEVELNVGASIEVLNVIKSPSGHIISTKWHIYRLPRSSSRGAGDDDE